MATNSCSSNERSKRKLLRNSKTLKSSTHDLTATTTPHTIAGEQGQQQQAKIPHLLSSVSSRKQQEEKDDYGVYTEPSNGKRRKVEHILDYSPGKPASTEAMYSFTNSRHGSHTNGSGDAVLIDLTSSPSTSPHARRISNSPRIDNSMQPKAPQKLKVKNLKAGKSDSSEFCTRTMQQLETALVAIFQNARPMQSNEELYRGAENICRLGKAPELARKLFEKCKEHIMKGIKQPLLVRSGETPIDGENNLEILMSVQDYWRTWSNQLTTIRSIFFYLDRAYLLQAKAPSIYESAVAQFRNHIYGDPVINREVLNGACELLRRDRMGNGLASKDLFSDTVKMFHELGVYTHELEPRLLADSQKYFSDWSDREIERPLPEYVASSVKLIDEEMKRCAILELDGTTKRALLKLLEDHLIERKVVELTNIDAVGQLLGREDEGGSKGLESLYSLLQRRRLGVKLRAAFITWIDETGTAIVFNDKEQERMVIRLLELKLKLDNTWRHAFHKNQELGHALRESFEGFMNKSKKSSATWNTDNSKPGEMIAKYVDVLLKAGAKAIPTSLSTSTAVAKPLGEEDDGEDNEAFDEDAEVNTQLDQVLDLFRFVHGKAVFEAFYKKDLARRLLMGRSASSDAERSMLTRLKTECGAGFTQNLEQMFKDIELSREEMSGYKGRLDDNGRTQSIDLNVNILSAAAWPTYPDVPVTIPIEIKKTLDKFETHYNLKHSGRKLSWKHALAHCQLKASFPKGNKEIVVSSFQAIVLLLFNSVSNDEQLSYEQIKAETGLSEAEVKRTLQSLACAKLRPLTKHPKGRDINDTDSFSINSNFSHEKYRIKINAIQLKETKEENKETHVRVAADRQFETQAAIVRIMKSRKTITHAELVSEVISATKTRGTLNVADIKKNIDKLIDKEYMERVENNSYSYLA